MLSDSSWFQDPGGGDPKSPPTRPLFWGNGHGPGSASFFASFHGDTNGLLTPYILKALNARRHEFGQFGWLMVGIDANAHCKGEPGKKLGINTLLAFMRTKRTKLTDRNPKDLIIYPESDFGIHEPLLAARQ